MAARSCMALDGVPIRKDQQQLMLRSSTMRRMNSAESSVRARLDPDHAVSRTRNLAPLQTSTARLVDAIECARHEDRACPRAEDEIERELLEEAGRLGIKMPESTQQTLDVITADVANLDLASFAGCNTPSESCEPKPMHSPHESSDSSTNGYCTAASSATSATTAPSPTEGRSIQLPRSRLRKNFRRLPGFGKRRKTVPAAIPVTNDTTCEIQKSPVLRYDALVASKAPTVGPKTPTLGPRSLSVRSPGGRSTRPSMSRPQSAGHGACPSAAEPRLHHLRLEQLREQRRLLASQAEEISMVCSRWSAGQKQIEDEYRQKREDMIHRHTTAMGNLEDRHFCAESDLIRSLETERTACNTRLKYMQAYCNPRTHIEGMPKRAVTTADRRHLELQLHLRDGLAALHNSRINVLRERQTRQIEELTGKHEQEIKALEDDLKTRLHREEEDLAALKAKCADGFEKQRQRLSLRWNMVEAIERRKIQLDTQVEYKALPTISWPQALDIVDCQACRDAQASASTSPESGH